MSDKYFETHDFLYVNKSESKAINLFYARHTHEGSKYDKGFIRQLPYHLEIIPNSVGYTVVVICDVCKEEFYKTKKNIEFREDVTDYKKW